MPSIEVRSHVETLSRVLRLPADASNGLDAVIGSASFSERLPEFHGRLAQARNIFRALPESKKDKVATFLARKTVSAHLSGDPITREQAHTIVDLITAFNEKGAMLRELRPQIENLVCNTVRHGHEKSVKLLIDLLGQEFTGSPRLIEARLVARAPDNPVSREEAYAIANFVAACDEKNGTAHKLRPKIEALVCKTVLSGNEQSIKILIDLLGDEFNHSPELIKARVLAHPPGDPITRVEAHAIADLITAVTWKSSVGRELRPKIEELVCNSVQLKREESVARVIDLLGEEFKNSPALHKARSIDAMSAFIVKTLDVDYIELSSPERRALRAAVRNYRANPEFGATCEAIFYDLVQNGGVDMGALSRLELLSNRELLHRGQTLLAAYRSLTGALAGFDPASASPKSLCELSGNVMLWGSILRADPVIGMTIFDRVHRKHGQECADLIVAGIEHRIPVVFIESVLTLFDGANTLSAPQHYDAAKEYLFAVASAEAEYAETWLKRAAGLLPAEVYSKIVADEAFQARLDKVLGDHASNALTLADQIVRLDQNGHAEEITELIGKLSASTKAFYAAVRVLRSPGDADFWADGKGEASKIFLVISNNRTPAEKDEPPTPSEFSSSLYPSGLEKIPFTDLDAYLSTRISALRAWDASAQIDFSMNTGAEISTQPADNMLVSAAFKILRYYRMALNHSDSSARGIYARTMLSDLLLRPEAQLVLFNYSAPTLNVMASHYKNSRLMKFELS